MCCYRKVPALRDFLQCQPPAISADLFKLADLELIAKYCTIGFIVPVSDQVLTTGVDNDRTVRHWEAHAVFKANSRSIANHESGIWCQCCHTH